MTGADEKGYGRFANERVHGTFYKYRVYPEKDDEAGWARLEGMLTNSELFFPSPGTLNDPFDCYPRIELRGEPDEIRKNAAALIQEVLERQGKKLSIAQLRSAEFERDVSSLIGKMRTPEYRNEKLFEVLDKATGVYCMCRRNDSILQWAYYGAGHCGFCLEFTIPEGAEPPFDYVAEVEYVPDRESVDIFELSEPQNRDFLWRMVRKKYKDWNHEREVRAFTDKPGLKRFAPKFLTGVVFGAKTTDDNKQWLRDQLAKSDIKVCYYQASRSFTHFELRIDAA